MPWRFLKAASERSLARSAELTIEHVEHVPERGGAILSGYGFTSEPDFLFVLDRASGRVLSKVKVASGPDYLIEKDGDLLVRTYDHDYVFAIE